MEKIAALGIDLGTSNSCLALCDKAAGQSRIVPVSQIAGPGKTGAEKLLPSVSYLPHAGESAEGAFNLPWDRQRPAGTCQWIVGGYARERGALLPDRAIFSAKSWLCNERIDRREAVLPWHSEAAETKLSPLLAQSNYLLHLKNACLDWCHNQPGPAATELASFEIVVGVPASFDEVARSLTLEAAELAGLGRITLLEEPLAAFYAWAGANENNWRTQISPGDIVLVCDVGGGTADFTLIAVGEEDGRLELERISVGEHILLGGDNMDLALALALKQKLEGAAVKKIDRWQFLSLVQAARQAKEQLFSEADKSEIPVAVAGRGSGLFASSMSTVLTRDDVNRVILDGFLPGTGLHEKRHESVAAGLKEYGLEYAADPALSRQLAHFLVRSLETVNADQRLQRLIKDFARHEKLGAIKPSKVLFNGGVLKALAIRERLKGLLSTWCGEEVVELSGAEYDLAVARGAAIYGKMRLLGSGLRIKARTLRSYYIGVESTMPAVPGYALPVNGLCVVPQGLEEGSVVELPERVFGLVTGQPVQFRFFSSEVRAGDRAGDIVEDAPDVLQESAKLEGHLPAISGRNEMVPVRLEAGVSEVGVLELWLKHTRSDHKWKLEFNVRQTG